MPQSSSGSPSRNSNGNGSNRTNGNGATLGFEEALWKAVDTLRGQVDAAEYKHVVLGLIFLKYISDAFAERFSALQREPYANPEDRDEYTAAGVFWVPPEARWLSGSNAPLPEIYAYFLARSDGFRAYAIANMTVHQGASECLSSASQHTK